MGIVDVYAKNAGGSPIPGVAMQAYYAPACLVKANEVANGVTDAQGHVRLTYWLSLTAIACIIIEGTLGSQVKQAGPIYLNPISGDAPAQTLVFTAGGDGGGNPSGPQFEIVGLFVKQVKNEQEVKNWDMLNVIGSPQYAAAYGGNPKIPAYTSAQGLHNFQIEATVKNLTTQSLSVKFRTQTCPRGQGGPVGGPFTIPPCGQLVDSQGTTIGAGETVQLPIWQLPMWSDKIDQHCWIVDVATNQVYNCGVDYFDNNYHYYPDRGYRADDWLIPIDVAGVIPGNPNPKLVTIDAPSSAAGGDIIAIHVTIKNDGGTGVCMSRITDIDTGENVSLLSSTIAGGSQVKYDHQGLTMPSKTWRLRATAETPF